MKKIIAVALLGATFSVLAKEVPVNSPELDLLFSNNTFHGVHYGKKTVQYFSDSGATWWMSSGDVKPSEGTWRIKNSQYCSNFGNEESCYDVVHDNSQDIYYFLKDEFRVPFIPREGYTFSTID